VACFRLDRHNQRVAAAKKRGWAVLLPRPNIYQLLPTPRFVRLNSMLDILNYDGPLGSRASLMMDIVALAMLAVVPVMIWSIYQVKYRRRYLLHKRVQLTLGCVLAVAVTLFEIHVNVHDWQARATGASGVRLPDIVRWALLVHLCCSIPGVLLWVFVIVQGLRKIPSPPRPSQYSVRHKKWARLAATAMLLTAITGWAFYILAFVV